MGATETETDPALDAGGCYECGQRGAHLTTCAWWLAHRWKDRHDCGRIPSDTDRITIKFKPAWHEWELSISTDAGGYNVTADETITFCPWCGEQLVVPPKVKS